MTYFVLGLACVLTSMFVMYEAKIFVEYVEAIYIFLAGFGSIGILATLRADMMSKYIEALESMVIYSECIQLFGNKNTRLNAKFFILKNRKIIDTNNTLRWHQSASGTLGKNHIISCKERDSLVRCDFVTFTKFFLLLHHQSQRFLHLASSNVVCSTDLWITFISDLIWNFVRKVSIWLANSIRLFGRSVYTIRGSSLCIHIFWSSAFIWIGYLPFHMRSDRRYKRNVAKNQ